MSRHENPIFSRFQKGIDTSLPNAISEELIGEYFSKVQRAVVNPAHISGMGSYRLHDETSALRMVPYAAYAFFPEGGTYAKTAVGLNRNGVPEQELDEQAIFIRMLAAKIPERIVKGLIPVAEDDEDSLGFFEAQAAVAGNPSLMLALTWNEQHGTIPLLYTLVGMSPRTGLSVVQYAVRQSLEKYK